MYILVYVSNCKQSQEIGECEVLKLSFVYSHEKRCRHIHWRLHCHLQFFSSEKHCILFHTAILTLIKNSRDELERRLFAWEIDLVFLIINGMLSQIAWSSAFVLKKWTRRKNFDAKLIGLTPFITFYNCRNCVIHPIQEKGGKMFNRTWEIWYDMISNVNRSPAQVHAWTMSKIYNSEYARSLSLSLFLLQWNVIKCCTVAI